MENVERKSGRLFDIRAEDRDQAVRAVVALVGDPSPKTTLGAVKLLVEMEKLNTYIDRTTPAPPVIVRVLDEHGKQPEFDGTGLSTEEILRRISGGERPTLASFKARDVQDRIAILRHSLQVD